jgi:hypothetical protein
MAKKAVESPKRGRGRPPKEEGAKGNQYPMRVDPEKKARWEQAAEVECLTLPSWIKRHLDLAANAILNKSE